MEQKDIDRLLICRAAVDKQREFNKARVEAVTTCKSVTEAKTLIESKTGVATTISADSAMKSPDAIKSTLEAERTKMTLKMNDILLAQGFESVSAFKEWQDKLCLEEYKRCRPGVGKCDWCGEKELKDQNCVKLYGLQSCTNRPLNQPPDEGAYFAGFMRHSEGITEIIKDKVCAISVCPKDHGYQMDVENLQDFTFDLFWGL